MLKHMLTSPQQQQTIGGNVHHHHHHASNGGLNGSTTGRLQLDSSQVMESRNDLNTITGNQQTSQPNQRYRNNNNTLNLSTASRQIHQQPLNISTLNSSKHSIGGSSVSPGQQVPPKLSNGGLNISRITTTNTPIHRHHHPNQSIHTQPQSKYTVHYPRPKYIHHHSNHGSQHHQQQHCSNDDCDNVGVKEMLVSLGLLCLVSLLLALLSLIFLLKISPVTANDIREILRAEQLTVITAEEYVVVYEVTLALCALTLSLNLCCLLVCAIQFLFAVKLVKSRHGGNARTNKYLQKSSISRVCAVAGFFISIPVFLTGIILYTFIQFHSTPAIVTSAFIGLGIVFCGCAMVHNVFIWQREKTNAVKAMAQQLTADREAAAAARASQNISITNPNLLNTSSNNIQDYNLSHFNSSILMHPPLLNSTHLSAHSALNTAQYGMRPSTTTPPTPTSPQQIGKLTVAVGGHYGHLREASGSISPGVPLNAINIVDKNSVGTTNSPHELSTLV